MLIWVLSHKTEDGSEKPIGLVSRTLMNMEQKYSQVEKGGLVCVFGVTRFHAYLFGHNFAFITDSKAIMSVIDSNRFHHKHQDNTAMGSQIGNLWVHLTVLTYQSACKCWYSSKRLELTELDGCIVWCGRVLIPEPGRKHILAELHSGHLGRSRMKALARMFVWWVARNGPWDWGNSSALCRVPTGSVITSSSAFTPLAMANSTMGLNTHWFCWSSGQPNVPDYGGRPF